MGEKKADNGSHDVMPRPDERESSIQRIRDKEKREWKNNNFVIGVRRNDEQRGPYPPKEGWKASTKGKKYKGHRLKKKK